MYRLKKISKLDILGLKSVASILNACGKDMAKKYNLHHWDNLYLKSLIIVGLCSFKNSIYLLYDEERPVATFMIKKDGDALHFEKLGTFPLASGRGAGSFCMKMIEQLAREASCYKVTMEVYEPSQHAISFYEHKGYIIVGTKDTCKYKEVKMEKRI